MNRFPWKTKRGPLDAHSPRDGGIRRTVRELSILVHAWRTESTKHPDPAAEALWRGAWTLDDICLRLTRGEISADDAHEWAVAGRTILEEYYELRTRTPHPAGHAQR